MSLTNSPHKSNIQVKLTSWRVRVLEEKQKVDLIIIVEMCYDCWKISVSGKSKIKEESHKESGKGLGISSAVSLM